MAKLDLEPLDLEPVEDKKSPKLDLEPLDLEPIDVPQREPASAEEPQSDISKTESIGQGLVQGATAGFSDELGGALGAGMEKIAGNPDNKSLKELYQEYRDMQRRRNKSFEDANPASYMAGNIGGAIAAAPVMPGGIVTQSATMGLGTSDADLTSGATGDMVQAGKDTVIGGLLGKGGSMLGKGIQKLLNPKSLETAGSKLASNAVGIKPTKELTTEWVKQGDHWVAKQGSDVIKGIGKTAVEEGALPLTGGAEKIYDKTLEAVQRNESKLSPLLQKAQQELGTDVGSRVEQVGHIGDKLGTFMNDFIAEIPETSKREGLIRKLFKTYGPQIERLNQADGNLVELNKLKQGFQQAASELDKNVFEREAANEAQFVKQLGGIVREHIEDLANSSGSGLGQQIKGINKTLSNLYNYESGALKAMDKGTGALDIKNLGADYAIKTAQKAVAKGMISASKAIKTPAGQLVQKTTPPLVDKAIANPFTVKAAQSASGSFSDQISGSLYGATDESLNKVAENLKQDPSLVHAAEELQKGIQLKDEQRKNSAIFLLLQKPNARKFLTPEE